MRLFIGVPIVGEAARALSETTETLRGLSAARYHPAVNLHITLAFLGERSPEDVPTLEGLLADVTRSREPFPLTLDGIGYWSRGVVFGRVAESEALDQLARSVRAALDAIGSPYEPHAFYPHITLTLKAPPPPSVTVEPVRFTVERAALFESRRTDEGRRYVPLASYMLGESL